MQSQRHLSDAELTDILAGHGSGEAAVHLAGCDECSAEWSGLAAVREDLRTDLQRVAGHPEHFWMRQRARVRERLVHRGRRLRWPIAAMAALALLSFALLSINSPTPAPPSQAQTAEADDLLLQDIQHSLAHQAPETLMPANILVQEMTTNSMRNEQKRDN